MAFGKGKKRIVLGLGAEDVHRLDRLAERYGDGSKVPYSWVVARLLRQAQKELNDVDIQEESTEDGGD